MADFPTDSSLSHVKWHNFSAEVKYFDESGDLQTTSTELGTAVECQSLPLYGGGGYYEVYAGVYSGFQSLVESGFIGLPDGTQVRAYSYRFVDDFHEYVMSTFTP